MRELDCGRLTKNSKMAPALIIGSLSSLILTQTSSLIQLQGSGPPPAISGVCMISWVMNWPISAIKRVLEFRFENYTYRYDSENYFLACFEFVIIFFSRIRVVFQISAFVTIFEPFFRYWTERGTPRFAFSEKLIVQKGGPTPFYCNDLNWLLRGYCLKNAQISKQLRIGRK